MKNVLLIKGQSQYDAMRYYIDEIEVGFRLAGYNTIIIDAEESAFPLQIAEIRQTMHIDYIFTCNVIVIEIIHKMIPEAVYITYICDHPAFLRKNRLELIREKDIVFVCDELHCEYVKKYYENIRHVKFIPLSGGYSRKYIPFSKREYEIVFTGSYEKPETVYNYIREMFQGSLKTLAEYMVQDIIKNPDQTLDMCLKHAFVQFDVSVDDKNEFNELVGKFMFIDTYARNYYRDKVIRTLVENDIPVHVYGNGWEKFESEHCKDNLIIEKGNSYIARKAVANAKVSLNVMPWFKAGFQERIATAMLSGTIAVTDESIYIGNNFEDQAELITYSLKHLDQLIDKIKYLLEYGEEAEKIANTGKERAERELTWQHRTFEMIEYIKDCSVGMKEFVSNHSYGNVLQIPYRDIQHFMIGKDTINAIDKILDIINELRAYDEIDVCDLKYLYNRYLYLFLKTKASFSEIDISDFVYNFITNIEEKDLETGIDLFLMECMTLQSLFLKAECNKLRTEKEATQNEIKSITINDHEQEVLIRKILKNYAHSTDSDILEIVQNISKRRSIGPYNQNFISKYASAIEELIKEVNLDEDTQMHYVIWNGKKMYYPKSHSRAFVASEFNFVKLEQDIDSPHRYLTKEFDVKEGDIVIDAGVAEGNFALDIIDRAKKVYLVECEREWVEALEKTFEPWKEKVVIIEKMLDGYDDEKHASIDAFVEEQEVNFIKMDVEGAEISALGGATKILENSKNIKCAICAYHRKDAEKDIRMKLEQSGFFTSTTSGYIFFREDIDSWVDGELRRGIVRAEKNN